MIHDYYLKEVNCKKIPLKEALAKEKRKIIETLAKEHKTETEVFYPSLDDLNGLPGDSFLIKLSFILKKPYTSKDEGEFYIIEGRIFKNPIVRDTFTGLPIVKSSTWKGHLKFAAGKVEWEEKEKRKIIKRLFGSEPEEDVALKGSLYFFPTFFKDEAKKYVITPLKRDTRTPANGPIQLEVMKPKSRGEFYLLYSAHPHRDDHREDNINNDLKFLTKALKLMFYTYGFSAKKTSGFGVINKIDECKAWIKVEDRILEESFQDLDKMERILWISSEQ